YVVQVTVTGLREHEPMSRSDEEVDPQECFELLDLFADRTLRDAELLGSPGETSLPGHDFEGLQVGDRRAEAAHEEGSKTVRVEILRTEDIPKRNMLLKFFRLHNVAAATRMWRRNTHEERAA